MTPPDAGSWSPVNVASHLAALARSRPEMPAVIFPHRRRGGGWREENLTYAALDERSTALARGLAELGIGRGTRVALLVKPSLEFFEIVFALFKAGAAMVCIDPGIGLRRLGRCLDEAEPEALIGIPAAHAARLLLGWGRRTLRRTIVVGRGAPLLGGSSLERVRRLGDGAAGWRPPSVEAGETAAILFTSGSTGPPKGVVYSHRNFAAQVDAIRAAFGIASGEVDLCTFPLFALFAPALGMTAVVPTMDFTRPGQVDPELLLATAQRCAATNLFGSPALLDRVGRFAAGRGIVLGSLRRVISAGAPVAARVLERFVPLLPPGARVFTPYGATESMPVTATDSDEILRETRRLTEEGRGVCVGRPVAKIEVRVIRIEDGPIEAWSEDLLAPPGTIGEIAVAGPVVTASYQGRPEATRLAKIRGPGGETIHRMGDLGYLDAQGRLWFCGRKSQRVRAAGGDLHTVPCEGVFNAHPAVRRSALVGVPGPGGERPVVCIELEAGARGADRARLREELLALASRREPTRGLRDLLFHPGFPVDIRHNAKIGREELSRWAARELR